MAKLILDESMRLNVIINGNEAQKELLDLESATRSLSRANDELKTKRSQLAAEGKKGTAEYKRLSDEIKINTTQISANKTRMVELQKEIGVTGLTMAQLSKRAAQLRVILAQTIPGSEDYKKYQAELTTINNRLRELRTGSSQTQTSVSKLANTFNKYAVLGASVVASVTGVVVSIQKMIDYNGKLSDSQADVMKTTGMTKKEVDDLTKSFGMLKTRTSRIDLLKIAEEGGRIGIVKNEIGAFVEVMNKANVALGDSFTGGVEEVASKLGKLKFLFKETKDLEVDKAYNAIGSAINDLGANGVATERNIAEFATNVGSLPDALKPSIAEALALGAAFEESGIEADKASRAYNIFLKQAATETAKFGKVMGISAKDVENMINSNPVDFFINFSQSLADMDMEGIQMAQTLEYLGVNADGANKILGAAANNTDRFREMIDMSNASMIDATSLINEYNIKNNNLAAILEKIKKSTIGWFSSEGFIKWLESATRWFAEFIGASDDAQTSAAGWREKLVFLVKILAVLTAALLTNITWQKLTYLWSIRNNEATKLQIFWTKAKTVAENAGIIVTQLFAAAQMLLAGNIKGATQAIRIMSATMATAPWGLVLALIAASVVAYKSFSIELKGAAKIQKMWNDIQLETNNNIANEVSQLETLLKIARDEKLSKQERLSAIKAINEISPEYLGNITLETINTEKATLATNRYIESLRRKAYEEVIASKRSELVKQKMDAESKITESYSGHQTQRKAHIRSSNNSKIEELDKALEELDKKSVQIVTETFKEQEQLRKEQLSNLDGWYANQIEKAEGNKKKLLSLESEYKQKKNKILGIITESDVKKQSFKPPDKDKNDDKDKDKLKDKQDQLNKELLTLQRQHQDNKLSLLNEGIEKELALEQENHIRKIADLEARKNEEPKISKEIDLLIEDEKTAHYFRVKTIQEKANEEAIKKQKETAEREATMRETAFLNELNGITTVEQAKAMLKGSLSAKELEEITTLEQAKEALKEEFRKRELQKNLDFLNTKIATLKISLGQIAIMGNIVILSDDERANLEDQLVFLENAAVRIQEAMLGKSKTGIEPTSFAQTEAGNVDVLGFSVAQWATTFDNLDTTQGKLVAIGMAIQALGNMWGQVDQIITNGEARRVQKYELDNNRQKAILQKRLNSGQISQEQYNKRVEKLDADLDKKKAEIEWQQAKRQKTTAIVNVLMNTAQAIMSIWAQVPKFDFGISAGVLSGIVGALGALQLGTIISQPLPARGAEEGFYPIQREQDGKMFNARYGGGLKSGLVNKPTFFLTGEGNKPEMILDSKVYSQMNPDIRYALHSEVARIRGFENGYYKNQPQPPVATSSKSNDDILQNMMVNIHLQNQFLQRLIEGGVYVSNKDLKSMENLKEGISDYEKFRNRSKI